MYPPIYLAVSKYKTDFGCITGHPEVCKIRTYKEFNTPAYFFISLSILLVITRNTIIQKEARILLRLSESASKQLLLQD
jgi:hypothetical protein